MTRAFLNASPVERRQAQRFLADLIGAPLGALFAEDTQTSRSAVVNPGASGWVAMVGSSPSKKYEWAGAIRQHTTLSSDYDAWEHHTETLTFDSAPFGTSLDMVFSANVKGRVKGTDSAVYIAEASVTVPPPRGTGVLFPKAGVVDVIVGRVRASWSYDKSCAQVIVPVAVEFRAMGRTSDFLRFTVVWFGNGDAPLTPLTDPPSPPFPPGP